VIIHPGAAVFSGAIVTLSDLAGLAPSNFLKIKSSLPFQRILAIFASFV